MSCEVAVLACLPDLPSDVAAFRQEAEQDVQDGDYGMEERFSQ